MKKIDLDRELSRIQNGGTNKRSNKYLPITISLFLCIFCVVGILSFSFAMSKVETSKEEYSIKINIQNGYQSLYVKRVDGSYFSDVIDSEYQIGEIFCKSGNLKYDISNRVVYAETIKEDTECTLIFKKEDTGINLDELKEIADNDGISYYFPADAQNNYFMLNYMLFRIVRINGDGSYRLVLNTSINELAFGDTNYDNSNVNLYLKEWYNNNLITNENIIRKDFDNGKYNVAKTDFGKNLVNIGGYSLDYIGLLSANEILKINGSYKIDKASYLSGSYYTMNETDENTVWAVNSDLELTPVLKSTVLGIRPVISIKTDNIKIIGSGTVDEPYKIEG